MNLISTRDPSKSQHKCILLPLNINNGASVQSTYFCTTVRVALVRSRRPVAGRRNNPTAPFPRPVKTPKIPRLRAPEQGMILNVKHIATACSKLELSDPFY